MTIRTAPTIVTSDGTRRPDLPDGVSFSVLADHGDTMTVDVDDAADRLDALTDAVEALAFDMLMQQMGGQ